MLATLVIGLREGLEAALIVGIIAAFLKRSGASLKPMWTGVIIALVLSVAVGFVLQAVETSLPQAQQETMEAAIGAVAVIFVTSMIAWMKTHARGLKKELEREAADALGRGTTWALAGMAFLAVMKEGFETSVFLLATFQASTSAGAAALGAVIGILAAVGIGIGLYTGGVKLNLGKFFTATGVFLVFVAAGLVVSTLRSAHEAGLVTIGQQQVADLSWLAPTGSVQAALITGVLGIPADPRLIEALGWFLYIVPVLAYAVWPAAWRPAPRRVPRIEIGVGAALGLTAIVLALAVPAAPSADVAASAHLSDGGRASVTLPTDASARLAFTGSGAAAYPLTKVGSGSGAQTDWKATSTSRPSDRPASLTLDQLVTLSGGRLPVGFDATRNPGPFAAAWTTTTVVTATTYGTGLVDAKSSSRTIVSLSGGGLGATRVLSVDGVGPRRVAAHRVTIAENAIADAARAAREVTLWRLWLPSVFAIGAVILLIRGFVRERAMRRAPPSVADPSPILPAVADATDGAETSTHNPVNPTRSTDYAAK